MVRLEGVSVSYPGGVRALKPTSLVFHKGEFTVLLGASGAGKSTMLRCLNGLVPATSGTIVADGLGAVTPGAILRRHRRRTAMVFQQHQLIGRLSVLKNVMTGRLGYYSAWRSLWPLPVADRRLCLDCIERVGLLPYALRRADQLSGGQQQRVGIARALAQKPSLILADEPVASLDPETARKVLTLLYDICCSDGISAIVSLHQSTWRAISPTASSASRAARSCSTARPTTFPAKPSSESTASGPMPPISRPRGMTRHHRRPRMPNQWSNR